MDTTTAAENRDESPAIAELAVALAKAQAAFSNVGKDREAKIKTKDGGEYKYLYADLASVLDVIRAPLAANGLAVIQCPSSNGAMVTVTTTLVHSSGQWVRGRLSLPVGANTPQAIGSAITYARRYSLSAMVGIATEVDDDGNAAGEGAGRFSPTSGAKRAPQQASAKVGKPSEEPPPSAPPVDKKAEAEAALKKVIAKRIYERAEKVGITGKEAQMKWVTMTLNASVPSKDWTPEHVQQLEASLVDAERVARTTMGQADQT